MFISSLEVYEIHCNELENSRMNDIRTQS
jgi:hypothetical protein